MRAPDPWLVFVIFLLYAVVVIFLYLRERRSGATGLRGGVHFWAMVVLRILALWLILAIIFQPGCYSETIEIKESCVALLLDDSMSMTVLDKFADPERAARIADAAGIKPEDLGRLERWQILSRILTNRELDLLRKLGASNRLKIYTFSTRPNLLVEMNAAGAEGGEKEGSAGPLADAFEKIESARARGRATAIGDSLNRAINDLRGQRVAALILFSDGRSNSGILRPEKVCRRLRKRNIPLLAVGVGNPEEPKDIALSDLEVSQVVLAGDYVPVDFHLKSRGFDGERADVELRLNDKLVKVETVVLRGKSKLQRVRIQFKPDKPGDYVCLVSIPPRPEEISSENNSLIGRIRVIDKKIKVLYVEGYPRWEYRYLKNSLVRDKNMEVQCVLQSADPGFIQESTRGISPAYGYPDSRKELFSYHVIIFGDVNPQRLSAEQLKLTREFVEDFGGGFLMIAGENWSPQKYIGNVLASLLPVEVEERFIRFSDRYIERAFRPELTDDGKEHAIMRLENDPELNAQLWGTTPYGEGGLPGFFWCFPVKRAKPAARVLAVHPFKENKYGRYPIFAVQYYGSGTTMFSAVDETWRWRAGVGDRYFYRFWGQAIRYLSTGRLLKTKRYSLSTDRSEYYIGEKVRLSAKVLDRDLKPSGEKTQPVHVEMPDGTRTTIKLQAIPGRPGHFEGVLGALKIGNYKAWIGLKKAKRGEELAFKAFQVKVPAREFIDPKMDEKALRLMATLSGGAYFDIFEAARLPEKVEPVIERISHPGEEEELWDKWYLIAAVAGLIIIEWILRKLARLL
jgi:hypothetical protein